jgi:hypothetical protein
MYYRNLNNPQVETPDWIGAHDCAQEDIRRGSRIEIIQRSNNGNTWAIYAVLFPYGKRNHQTIVYPEGPLFIIACTLYLIEWWCYKNILKIRV